MEFYWRKVHSLNLKCLMMADEEWIEVSELIKELGLKGNSAIAKKVGLRTAQAPDGKLLIARQSIKDLAVRMRAGTNNRVLIFKAVAEELTYGLPANVLVQKAVSVEMNRRKRYDEALEKNRKTQALANALGEMNLVIGGHRDVELASNERMRVIWSELQKETGLNDEAIRRFFSGKSTDQMSREAYKAADVAKKNLEHCGYFESKGRGRTPKITAEICRQIQQRALHVSPEVLAREFEVGVTVVRKIIGGSYKTKSTQTLV